MIAIEVRNMAEGLGGRLWVLGSADGRRRFVSHGMQVLAELVPVIPADERVVAYALRPCGWTGAAVRRLAPSYGSLGAALGAVDAEYRRGNVTGRMLVRDGAGWALPERADAVPLAAD